MMLRWAYMIFFCVVCFGPSVTAQPAAEDGIQFFHGTWSEVLAKSKDQKRLIFVDAFAQWCGPCKRMAATTFKDKTAGDYFNKHFINYKVDMEAKENEEFARKYPVSSYPTLMMIDESGKILIKDVGAKDVEKLIEFGKKALSAGNKSVELGKRYDAGERDPQLIHDYIVELNKAGKPCLKVVNEYLRGAKPEAQEITEKIIFEGTVEADSKVFDKMAESASKYRKLYGDERVDSKITDACQSTVLKAIQFKSTELLQEAIDKFAKLMPKPTADEFGRRAYLDYFSKTRDAVGYVGLIQQQEKDLSAKNNYAAIDKLVTESMKVFPNDAQVLQWAEEAMKRVVKEKADPLFYFTLVDVQQRATNFKDALKSAKKGKELAEKTKDVNMVNKFDYMMKMLEERI